MRTTIKLDDNLLHDLKVIALESERSMTDVVEDACREFIYRRRVAKSRPRVELTVFDCEGVVLSCVDLTNSASLWAMLDEADASH